jgi:hypothetical protein
VNRIAYGSFTVAALFLALSALFTPHHVTPSHSADTLATPPTIAREPAARPQDEPDADEETDAIIDLYGNDVSPAVATYSLDAFGTPYEVHSPQTELPRLGSPKT